MRGLNVKRYPSCYDTSRTAEAALWLAPRIDAAQIAEVLITVEPGGLRPLIHHRPQTGLEGKFSLEFVAAAALLDGRVGLSTFTDESVRRPAVRTLMTKIKLDEQAVPPTGSRQWQESYSVIRYRTVTEPGSSVGTTCRVAMRRRRSRRVSSSKNLRTA